MESMEDRTPGPPSIQNLGKVSYSAFMPIVPYDVINKIIAIAQTDPMSLLTNPENLKLLFWALGCLTELVSRFIKNGLITQDQYNEALTIDASVYAQSQESPTETHELLAAIDLLGDVNRDLKDINNPAMSQFGVMTAMSVITAIAALYKIWQMLAPKPQPTIDSHDRIRIINRKRDGK